MLQKMHINYNSKQNPLSSKSFIRNIKEIEYEIRSCIRELHRDFNDEEKASFWRGRISSLEWVLGR